jgi:hypothetical protein
VTKRRCGGSDAPRHRLLRLEIRTHSEDRRSDSGQSQAPPGTNVSLCNLRGGVHAAKAAIVV